MIERCQLPEEGRQEDRCRCLITYLLLMLSLLCSTSTSTPSFIQQTFSEASHWIPGPMLGAVKIEESSKHEELGYKGKRQNLAFKTAVFQRHVNSCMQWEKLWIQSSKSGPWSSVWPYVRHLTFNLSKAHCTHLYNGDDNNIYFIDLGRLWESMHMKMICKLHVSDCSKTQNNLCSSVPLQDKPG